MPDLAKRYPPTWRGWPPAMPQGDRNVWQLFLEAHGTEWTEYAYDVELHAGAAPPPGPDPVLAKAWARLTAKRVDVVAFRAGRATLIEVRHAAAWQSVGQLIGYRDLFPLDYPDQVIEGAAIVTDAIDPQIRAVAERQGLQVITV